MAIGDPAHLQRHVRMSLPVAPWPAQPLLTRWSTSAPWSMVQSNFSDPDEDMLSYMASSSDDMIATVRWTTWAW